MDSENRFQEFGKMITAMQNDFKTLGGINMTTLSEAVSKIEVKELKEDLKESNRIQDELFNETKRQEKLIEELYDSKDDLYKVVKTLIEENTTLNKDVKYLDRQLEIYQHELDELNEESNSCSCCEDE